MKQTQTFDIPTVSASVAVDVATRLKREGIDPQPVFKETGINPQATQDPYQQVRLDQYTSLLELAAETTKTPALGLELGIHQDPSKWGAFGYVVLNSPTVGEALSNMARFLKPSQGGTHMAYLKSKNRLGIEYTILHPKVCHKVQDAEFAIAYIKNIVDRLSERQVTPLAVYFEHNPVSDSATYKRLLGIEPHFDQPVNAIFYSSAIGEKVVYSADRQLLAVIKHHLIDMANALPDDFDLIQLVAYHIRQALPSRQCRLEHIARLMATSARTLQRHLNEHGTNFAEVLDNTRRDLAMQYMANPTMEIKEICYLLGFNDPSAYIKSFKKWTGTTPGRYREQLGD